MVKGPAFPPWLGEDGIKCMKAVLQQQVEQSLFLLDVTQH